MRFPIGKDLLLLENMSFKGAGQSQPIATATILGYTDSGLYKIAYEVLSSGEKGELEVPEDRLFSNP